MIYEIPRDHWVVVNANDSDDYDCDNEDDEAVLEFCNDLGAALTRFTHSIVIECEEGVGNVDEALEEELVGASDITILVDTDSDELGAILMTTFNAQAAPVKLPPDTERWVLDQFWRNKPWCG